MKHMSTDEVEKMKETKVELTRLLDEEEHLRSEQRQLLNRLEQKQVLNREKIEQDKLELYNQEGEVVIGISSKIKEGSRTKEEKNEAE